MHETPEGYLVCLGVAIARTGEMTYGAGETPIEPGKDGVVSIHREADEVFRPETMASFEGKALTIMHPSDFVTPENWKSLAKGIIQNVRQGKGAEATDLIADILIMDAEAIALVKNGLREVSCGYEAEYFETGEGEGVQKNIIGNHLALVDEGRAGEAYAINDHKGKESKMKLADKIKAIFAKAQDEALKVAATTDAEEEKPKEEKAKDDEMQQMGGYDALIKAVKDLDEKVSAMSPKGKDASTQPNQSSAAEIVAKDDEAPSGLEERLAKCEAMLAKLMERESKEDEVSMDAEGHEGEVISDEESGEEGEMVGDEDSEEEGEESEDDAYCDTADAKSRIEILAPGKIFKGKDAKAKALKAAYATTDGKTVIDQFTAGKAPDLKNQKFVDTLFVAASEVLKVKRSSELSKTKTHDFQSDVETKGETVMTPEKMNELNAKHYGKAN